MQYIIHVNIYLCNIYIYIYIFIYIYIHMMMMKKLVTACACRYSTCEASNIFFCLNNHHSCENHVAQTADCDIVKRWK